MTRTDNDTWDLASSVGATATMIATARALASRAENPLINDPFAEPLVRAVGIDLFTRLASGELRLEDIGDHATGGRWMIDNIAIRTKFYDDFFGDATTAGIRQVVILAAGLDTRAYRLPWPPGTVVYEIDQPAVIKFKTRGALKQPVKPGSVTGTARSAWGQCDGLERSKQAGRQRFRQRPDARCALDVPKTDLGSEIAAD